MPGEPANAPAQAPEDEDDADCFQQIGAAAWRALKAINIKRKSKS